MGCAPSCRVLRIAVAATMVIAGISFATAALSVTSDTAASATVIWSPVTEVPGSPGGTGGFMGVSCTGPGDCTAVGQAGQVGNHQPFFATEAGGVWGPPTEVPGSLGGGGRFLGVSCTGPGACTAVGSDHLGQPTYATETGGVWSPPTEVPGSGGGTGSFSRVSCTGSGECTAVGQDNNYPNNQPIYATETGGVWGSVVEVPDAGVPNRGFMGVSCTGPGECTAIGNDNAFRQPFYVTETGGVWGAISQFPGFPGAEGAIWGVSCTGRGACTAVGVDNTDSRSVYVAETGGTWGTPTELSDNGGFRDLSCTGVGACTAAGTIFDNITTFKYVPTYATETGGVWGPVTKVFGSPRAPGFYLGVSCTGPGTCTAVGDDGNAQPVYASSMFAAPAISSFSPASGPAGTVVTIRGTNLDGATNVTVNGVTATITVDTAIKIKITVPAVATTGKIKVFTLGGKAKTATVFAVT